MDNKKEQEIPFGAFDSELMHQEINIPEGFEATIEGNKIILTRTESKDDEIRKELLEIFKENKGPIYISLTPQKKSFLISLLEKQGSEPKWCHHKVDLSGCSEEYRKAYYDGWNNCNQQHSQCKSEWNDVVKCLINGMKFYYEDNEEATWGTEKFSMKVKDILSWLEKQGRQKPIMIQWQGNNLKEVIDFTGKDKNFEKWFKSFEEYEKYVDDHNGIFKLFNADGSHYEVPIGSWIVKTPDGYNVASKAFFRQKPAWSEEDERIYQSIMDDTVQENQLDGKQIDWLRDIKYRYFPQSKQEWSEEEKGNVDIIVSRLEVDIEYWKSRSKRRIDEDKRVIDWLKSLRPQSTWKPSKEQMEVLVWCMPLFIDPKSKAVLESLIKDLKKL